MTRLLLGLGLRSFSMHPSQILAVKQQVLRSDMSKLKTLAQLALSAEEPAKVLPA
jgi:phosphotransferase system enzyme I (PtsI)